MARSRVNYKIKIDNIQAVDALLANTPPKPKIDHLSTCEAIGLLKPRIVVLKESGYSIAEITRLIEKGGFGASHAAIRVHVQNVLKPAKAAKPARRM